MSMKLNNDVNWLKKKAERERDLSVSAGSLDVPSKPFVVKSDDNTKFMILDQGFAASCIDGVWTEKALFNGYQLDQDFNQVDDPDEADKIIKNAKTFLGK